MPPKAKALRERARLLKEQSLFRNSVYIMGTTAVTSLFGFGFWIVAARWIPTAEVGRAAALVSAMMFVSILTNLGLGQVFVSRLASREAGESWSLTVTTGLAVAAIMSLVGGALAAALLPAVIPALDEGLDAGTFLLIPVGVAGAACSLVIDHACIAERHAKLAFVRNAVASVFRLLAIGLAAFGPLDATWVLAIWASSFLLIDVFAVTRTLPALGHGFRPALRGWRGELAEMKGLIVGHQSINLGAQASTYLLPLIVAARLGAEENAYFYTTFMISSALFFIAPAISSALFAEGVHAPSRLRGEIRKAARYIGILASPPAIVLLLAGPLILELFGPNYSDEGSALLRILVVAALFDAVYQLALGVLRATHRLSDAATVTWVMLVVGIAFTWVLLPPLGLEGAGIGWAIGKIVAMAMAVPLAVRGSRLYWGANADSG